MRTIKIKPLSVNACWQGRRFKTQRYKAFEKEVLLLLPNKLVVPPGKLKMKLKWGFSSPLSDWDNPIKPFQDILQKKYNFNDKKVFKCIVEKQIVKKGNEFIKFEITKL